jgi:hypothetical protein
VGRRPSLRGGATVVNRAPPLLVRRRSSAIRHVGLPVGCVAGDTAPAHA